MIVIVAIKNHNDKLDEQPTEEAGESMHFALPNSCEHFKNDTFRPE
jgi:hypothetical protein